MKRIASVAACMLAIALSATAAHAKDLPYDEHANASAELQQALHDARDTHKDVLLVFGANWCPDCRVLDTVLHGKGAEALGGRFVVVKVDVGNFDRNIDLAKRYEIPLNKGIPAAAVVSGDDRLLYVTKAGELADAHRMGESAIVDFLSHVAASATPEGR
ncbi:MAG TPA: thioredoxin family protein [Burkholderiaceae bacterium]|jgi:protein disulfide-isomerase|nr:thioredoxin family protein [Burkholderiaceae bacterium]